VVDASMLQTVSTLHDVVTMLSVWQEHTASVCEAYSTIAVGSYTFIYFRRVFLLHLPLLRLQHCSVIKIELMVTHCNA
jgi:hypothetical protein